MDAKEGHEFLWGKTKRALKYLYEHELGNFDWFLKADDDTYVIMENLRFMLLAYSPTSPIYFGFRFKAVGGGNESLIPITTTIDLNLQYVRQGYMSGGAGYVMSKEALRRMGRDALTNRLKCKLGRDTGPEDVELGYCLQAVGVVAGDSRDSLGRHRMLPLAPIHHLLPNNSSMPEWFYRMMYDYHSNGVASMIILPF